MSRARHNTEKKEHHKRASGGGIPVAGGDPQVVAEAKADKKNVGVIEGEKSKKRGDRMAVKRGGKVHERAAGGRVKGADLSPFSSAHDGGPKVSAGSDNEGSEEAHKRGGKVSKRAHGGKVEHHGAHPVHKGEHGEEPAQCVETEPYVNIPVADPGNVGGKCFPIEE